MRTGRLRMMIAFKNTKVFFYLLIVRLISALLVTTHFVPDEYWQSLEVAHRMVFGYGYLTWEWRTGIRNYLYPSLFAFLYKILHLLNLDYRVFLIVLPRVVQAIFSAVGESCTVHMCRRMFGDSAAFWTLLCLQFNWFLFYCGSRTLTNTMETALTAIALYYYPWQGVVGKTDLSGKVDRRSLTHKKSPANVFLFLNVAAVSVIIRPTSLVLWLPMCAWHLFLSRRCLSTWIMHATIGIYSLAGMMLLDRIFYGRWIFSLYNFVHFNVIDGLSAHYGTNPFHFYWTLGFPTIMATHLLPFLIEATRSWRSPLLALILWQLLAYSLIAHKEIRFIMPVLPMSLCLVGKYLASIETKVKQGKCRFWNAKSVFSFLAVTNLAMALPLGMFHMQAPLDVVDQIASLPQPDAHLSVLFLTPCHSTPLYSHLHRNISTRILHCEPNLGGENNYTDEMDVFFKDPLDFLQRQYGQRKEEARKDVGGILWSIPTHIVMFDKLLFKVGPFLRHHNFQQCGKFVHSYINEGAGGKHMLLFCATGR